MSAIYCNVYIKHTQTLIGYIHIYIWCMQRRRVNTFPPSRVWLPFPCQAPRGFSRGTLFHVITFVLLALARASCDHVWNFNMRGYDLQSNVFHVNCMTMYECFVLCIQIWGFLILNSMNTFSNTTTRDYTYISHVILFEIQTFGVSLARIIGHVCFMCYNIYFTCNRM